MKILHTADWHLGKRLNDISRMDEQRSVLQEIIDLVDKEDPSVILVAGDLYDTYNPPNEAVELFYKTLHKLAGNGKRAVIAIAGNHDSADRIEAPDPLARECGIIFSGYPDSDIGSLDLESGLKITRSAPGFIEIIPPGQSIPVRILLTPYANETRIRKFLGTEDEEQALRDLLQDQWDALASQYCDSKGINLLIAHLFMMKEGEKPEKEPEDERSILHIGGAQPIYTSCIPDQIQYTALGHLHRQHFLSGHQGKVAYSGSLLEYSFSEAEQQKYVMLIEAEPGKEVIANRIPLTSGRPLFRKRFENNHEAIEWLNSNKDCFVEITLLTENYLDAGIKKELHQIHDGVLAIIPEMTGEHAMQDNEIKVDLSKEIEQLFIEYFEKKNGTEPTEELLHLFREIKGAGS